MKKYKLDKNGQKGPTDEQIRRYKDFSTLSHKYERLTKRGRKPLYRDPKMFILLLLLGLIFLLVFLETEKEKSTDSEPTQTERKREK
ncbi:MAG: hypothetical protein R3277_04825 [Brumimicrobium sp.]|nr:hypothetical protein [Brumimicrobium sp.]